MHWHHEAFASGSGSLDTTSGLPSTAIALGVEDTATSDGGDKPNSLDDNTVDFNIVSPAPSSTLAAPPIRPSVGLPELPVPCPSLLSVSGYVFGEWRFLTLA